MGQLPGARPGGSSLPRSKAARALFGPGSTGIRCGCRSPPGAPNLIPTSAAIARPEPRWSGGNGGRCSASASSPAGPVPTPSSLWNSPRCSPGPMHPSSTWPQCARWPRRRCEAGCPGRRIPMRSSLTPPAVSPRSAKRPELDPVLRQQVAWLVADRVNLAPGAIPLVRPGSAAGT